MRDKTTVGGFFLLCLLFPGILRFSTPAATTSAEDTIESFIRIEKGVTKQGYPFLAGGIGSAERAAMEQMGKRFNLKLSFAEKSGHYLADVNLLIKDSKGTEIISTTVEGPWFYIHLPRGLYNVKAVFGGTAKEINKLDLPEKGRVHRIIHWDLGSSL